MTASESNPLALLIERSASSPGFRITQLTSGHSPIWEQPAKDVFTFVPCGDRIRISSTWQKPSLTHRVTISSNFALLLSELIVYSSTSGPSGNTVRYRRLRTRFKGDVRLHLVQPGVSRLFMTLDGMKEPS